jgi:two-component system, chemotaxis family, protein-glutamate methylesterase/glutaminase
LIDLSRPRSSLLSPGAAALSGSGVLRADDAGKIKIAIVDDSVVVRGLVSRWLEEEPSIAMVGSYRNGIDAVAGIVRSQPDILILDIEMPDMDGVTALPILLKLRPGLIVIMASTLTARGADVSLRCLALGATDYVTKPSTHREVSTSTDFRRMLIEKVLHLSPRRSRAVPVKPSPTHGNVVALRQDGKSQPIQLRYHKRISPRALLIGASTGGPQAITKLTETLGPIVQNIPVLITQHMPETFTSMFAEHLRKKSDLDVVEAIHEEPVRPGRIYIAPGGQHMLVEPFGRFGRIRLSNGEPVNFCRPAVDLLFESGAATYGADVIAVTLTGMGVDGARGSTQLAAAGATVIAQDEATSVVWGMPGAVARSGVCNAVLPIEKIGNSIASVIGGQAP